MRCVIPAFALLAGFGLIFPSQFGFARQAALNEPPRCDANTFYPPGISPVPVKSGLVVNTANRGAVAAFYHNVYLDTAGIAPQWTGDVAACAAGTTSDAYLEATLRRVNYYRAMAGLPAAVASDAALNAQCQQAALMMAANNNLSHTPPASWSCYTAGGAEAAGHSNIALGAAGPEAIDLYMEDFGSGNTALGHRRWVLFPPLEEVGTGSVNWANALWVINSDGWGTLKQQASWPPEGYAPYPVVFDRWSFSYPGADFAAATVSMKQGSTNIEVTVLPMVNGYGDNTIAWEPDMVIPASGPDTTYTVKVGNVTINAVKQSFTYDVTLMDPGDAPLEGETPEEGELQPPATVEEAAQDLLDLFTAADTDDNGSLSAAEAAAAVQGLPVAYFEEIDSNNDGNLTQDELTAVANPDDAAGCQCAKSGGVARVLQHRLADLFLVGLSMAVLLLMRIKI